LEKIIDNLLNDFEQGKMSRRQLIQTLAVATASTVAIPALGAESPHKLVASSVNHISYGVADYAKTRDFYSDLLGMKVSHDNGKQAFLEFGNTLLLVRKTHQPDNKPYIDHVCYTLDNWDENAVEAELRRRGLDPRADMGGGSKSFHVKDPDGFDLQVAPPLDLSKL
jgi:catechol 2,3-dioxygenase-like lactoylglutathione lyase family enzyme